jgi:hypothetical protein
MILVWERVKNDLNLSDGWSGQLVNEFFENWVKQNFAFPTLPAFICWFIWLDRNKTIFESGTPSIQKIVFLSLGAVGNHRKKGIFFIFLDYQPHKFLKIKSLCGSMGQHKRMEN